jgi:hypothetical protein
MYNMNLVTRRQFLLSAALLAAPASFTGCQRLQPASKSRHAGTFSEGGLELAKWLEGRNYSASLKELEGFRDGLPFEIDQGLWHVVSRAASAKTYCSMKKDGHIFEWAFGDKVLFGRIVLEARIKNWEVYSIAKAYGEGKRVAGASTSVEEDGTTRIFIYEEKIREGAPGTMEKILELQRSYMPESEFGRLKAFVEKDGMTMQEFTSYANEVAWRSGATLDVVQTRFSALRLRPRERDFVSQASLDKAVADARYGSLLHELVHAALGKAGCGNGEMLAILAQIAHGPAARSVLADVMVTSVSGDMMDVHTQSARATLHELKLSGFDFSDAVTKPDETRIRSAALLALERVSMKEYGKRFSQLVDPSILNEARMFADSVPAR